MPAPSLRGRFVWHELMTTDPDAAARFYPAVTGWKVQTWEHNPAYRLWTMGGAPMAGLMALPDHSRRIGHAACLAELCGRAGRGRHGPPGDVAGRAHVRRAAGHPRGTVRRARRPAGRHVRLVQAESTAGAW